MCGRYVVTKAVTDLLPDLLGGLDGLPDDYNVAPTALVPVVRARHGERVLAEVKWGFLPSYAKDEKQRPQPINARLETVATSGMFKRAFARSRCVVPALGYYEWVVTPTGKQPHFIHAPGAGLAMAGVLSAWSDPARDRDDPERWSISMAIITRAAHVAPGEVHDRMPACLSPRAGTGGCRRTRRLPTSWTCSRTSRSRSLGRSSTTRSAGTRTASGTTAPA
ncbi:SOS response-associated peptidase [Amnibacterium kyonggiense]